MPCGRHRQTVRLGTGLTIPYVAQGDRSGAPVVLLHAWGESLGSFDRVLPCTAVPPTETGTITAPALVIWGARDGLLSRDDEEALAAAIPGSRLIAYDDTGHLVLWEQPERVANDLTDFVKGLTA